MGTLVEEHGREDLCQEQPVGRRDPGAANVAFQLVFWPRGVLDAEAIDDARG